MIYHESMNGKQVVARLKAAGWVVSRINGSHHIMSKGSLGVTVPVHGAHDIKPGTPASIAQQAGVKLK